MKKNKEYSHLERFKKIFDNFPDGEIDCSEKPDFIVKSNNTQIGIEVTELYRDRDSEKASKLKKQESLEERVCTILQSKLNENWFYSDHFDIHFHKNFDRKRVNGLVEDCIKSIKSHMQMLNRSKSFDTQLVNDCRLLPFEVDSIIVNHDQNSKELSVMCVGADNVPGMNKNHILSILEDKNEKLMNYQNCDAHWLLIVQPPTLSGSFAGAEMVKKISFKTSFDRVFILDKLEGSYFELIIEKK